MPLPDGVYDLALSMDRGDRTFEIHPSAIETDRGLVLCDVGMGQMGAQLLERLETVGFGVDDVHIVLLTHQDGDHAGALSWLRERADPVVIASEHAAAVIAGRAPTRGPDDGERYRPAPVDVAFAGELTFDTAAGPARVIPTPGHTPGHVSVYLPDGRFLIAADALTADEDGLCGPSERMSEDADAAMDSVATLADLSFDATLCYHGGLVEAGSAGLDSLEPA